jgi:hypothetical protein
MNAFAGLQEIVFLPQLYAEGFGCTENVITF